MLRRAAAEISRQRRARLMRRAARVDANQAAIVEALRRGGASVISLAAVGKGCPDLLVGYRGMTWLIEVKDGSKPPSERRLTPLEAKFAEEWRGGNLFIAMSVRDALEMVFGPQD